MGSTNYGEGRVFPDSLPFLFVQDALLEFFGLLPLDKIVAQRAAEDSRRRQARGHTRRLRLSLNGGACCPA